MSDEGFAGLPERLQPSNLPHTTPDASSSNGRTSGFGPEDAGSIPADAAIPTPVFLVWDKVRQCWAGETGALNERSLEDYALEEFKDAGLVYCDMEGWALSDDGSLMLVDECGNHAWADGARYEVRFNPKLRAESAESRLRAVSEMLQEARREHGYSCCSPQEGCTCGADAWNARVDAALADDGRV